MNQMGGVISSPGRSHRKGITLLLELAKRAPDEATARKWIEAMHWRQGVRSCLRCRCANVYRCKHSKMPRHCRKYFSVKTGAAIQYSNLPLSTSPFYDSNSIGGHILHI